MRRRHRFVHRIWPLIGALLLVVGVMWVGSLTFSTKDSQIVLRAAAIRMGDEDAEQPPAPAVAIDLLRTVVQRSPDHYDAYMELASCWSDLRAYDNAVKELQRAAAIATELPDKVRALRRARSFLTLAQRYDEAVDLARDIAALQPEHEVLELHVGLALYEGSVRSKRDLQREYRIVVTGPTTLAALLNSLQMGFRTLAIEKRSSEVWELLGAVKTEFGKFGDVLAKTKKKLQEASNTIDKAEVRTRAIERKLRKVQEVPQPDTVDLVEEDQDIS